MPKVLLLTGAGGAGKSTVAEIIAKREGYVYLDGDNEDTEFFPDGNQWLPKNTKKLQMAHNKILQKTVELVEQGKSVAIDYIIFGRYAEFVHSFQEKFGDGFSVIVLSPSQEELIKRDIERECWTTGADRIAVVSAELEAIKDVIGIENFLDTTGQSPEETMEALASHLHD